MHIVSCCEGGTVVAWSSSDHSCRHTFREHTGDINDVKWSPVATANSQQHLLATASQDQTVRYSCSPTIVSTLCMFGTSCMLLVTVACIGFGNYSNACCDLCCFSLLCSVDELDRMLAPKRTWQSLRAVSRIYPLCACCMLV